MKTSILRLIVIAIPVISGCASQPIVLAPVGPAPASAEAHAPMGPLQIFTATETHPDGDNTYYYHKGYCILSDAGKMLHFVPNHIGTMDETPSIVNVSAGQYRIPADAEGYLL